MRAYLRDHFPKRASFITHIGTVARLLARTRPIRPTVRVSRQLFVAVLWWSYPFDHHERSRKNV